MTDPSAATPSVRMRAWLNDVQLSNRLGCPHYDNPGQLKHDLSRLLDVADAAERYLAASNTLAFRPTKEIETAAAQAHHDLTEALNVVNS